MRIRWMAALAVVLSMDAGTAKAQAGTADTVRLPADTTRLPVERITAPERCGDGRIRVVDTDSAAAEARALPGCAGLDLGDLRGRLVVGLPLTGDCNVSFRVDAWLSVSLREYRVHSTTYDGGCRAWGGGGYYWLALPNIPHDWRVTFSSARAERPRSGPASLRRQLHLPQPRPTPPMPPVVRDDGIRPDSAGLARDAVPLAASRVRELDECQVVGMRVVDDSASALAMRRWGQCRDADFGAHAGRTLIGVPLSADCHAQYRVEAFRSNQRREYRVRVTDYYGGCRAGRSYYVWISVPQLPAGWTVGLTEERTDERRRWDVVNGRIQVVGDTARRPD